MGLVYADISLSSPVDVALVPIEVIALVNSGALHLCIPEHIALQLNLNELEQLSAYGAVQSMRKCT